MIRTTPEVVDVKVGDDALFFAVVVGVDDNDMPGVSVKGAPLAAMQVFVTGAAEVARKDGVRTMRFDVEAERGPMPWVVNVVASCGKETVPLVGPTVPAKD